MMTGSSIEVFEGSGATVSPAVDSAGVLAIEAFSNALRRLEAEGVRVERHDVRKDKSALDANPTVKNAFEAQGPDCLPMVLVNETIISVGGYPTRVELMEAAGMSPGTDPEFLGEVTREAAALGAALAANAFERFQQHYERLRLLGLRDEDLTTLVQSGAAAAAGLVRDDLLTRVDQFLSFGPDGRPPKPRCTCTDNV